MSFQRFHSTVNHSANENSSLYQTCCPRQNGKDMGDLIPLQIDRVTHVLTVEQLHLSRECTCKDMEALF